MYKVTNQFIHGNKITRLIHHTKRMICMPIGELLAPFVSLLTVSSTFDLLFKVLFTFPSLYFFAIGLPKMFSFRWDLPPVLGCNPKQPDSSIGWHVLKQYLDHGRDSHPLWCLIPKNLYPRMKVLPPWQPIEKLQFSQPSLPCGKAGSADFKFELCLLHSPLLKTSLLVSFPPLSDMLKFSG